MRENNVAVDSPLYYFHYEVIKIRKRDAESFKRFGTLIKLPMREIYPTDNTWGLYGWTYEDLKGAEVYFIKLSEKMNSTESRKVNVSKLSR